MGSSTWAQWSVPGSVLNPKVVEPFKMDEWFGCNGWMVGIRYLKKTLLSQSSAHCGLYLINHLVTWRFHAKGHFIEKFGQEGNFRMGSETGTMTYTRGSVLDTKVMDPFKMDEWLGYSGWTNGVKYRKRHLSHSSAYCVSYLIACLVTCRESAAKRLPRTCTRESAPRRRPYHSLPPFPPTHFPLSFV
jgi:hypothetical protein